MLRKAAEAVARAARQDTGASHPLAVLIAVGDGPDRIDFGGIIHLAIAAEKASNPAARASMAGVTGCASARSSSASTAWPLPPRPARHRAHRFRAGVNDIARRVGPNPKRFVSQLIDARSKTAYSSKLTA
jgi:hypothetical protein